MEHLASLRQKIPFLIPEDQRPIRVHTDTLVPFFRRLSAMLAAGINVARSLDFLSMSEDDPKLAEALRLLVKQVNAGHQVSRALKAPRLRELFTQTTVSMLMVGEQTGALSDVIEKTADLQEKQQKLRREFIGALTYPAVLGCMICLVALIFVFVLGNKDQGLFAMFGGNLPWPSKVLVSAAEYLRNPGKLLLGIGVLAGIGLAFWTKLKTDKGFRLRFDSLVLTLPVFGPVVAKVSSARMLYVISASVAVGIPMSKALSLALEVCDNTAMRERLDRSIILFREGNDLAECLEKNDVFPKLVTSMLHTGLETGQVDVILGKLSNNFEEDVSQTIADATRLAEPILLGFSGAVAGFLALATLMPIIQLVNHL